ncbi:MAG TPA: UDP-N-acetylmuramoyl-L-alanine--D-glutamate ligase [Solirubrobacteraceae bacterium]|nr:UDP-N-acetylmuramoyl-L-alanine--D-glutamate ligase [Solirubrobacteraceae bacterium]
MLLLDASVWVAALDRDDRFHAAARQITTGGGELAALDLTLYEVANAVRRRSARTDAVSAAVRAVLAASTVVAAAAADPLALAAEIALRHDITVYDALYVAVARQRALTLVSADLKDLVSRGLAITPEEALATAPRHSAHPSREARPVAPRPPIPPGPYLVVGLARSGIAAARLLASRGERVIGVDVAVPAGGDATLIELRGLGVEVRGRDDGLAHVGEVAAVVKSPGVPAQAPVIAAARERGLPVLGELELAWRLLPNELVAVTGTNGKTTTVELIGHIHREAGLPVAVAGNVGVALSGLPGHVDPAATIVCEASSFQLEDAVELAPEAAVLLNITPDHLDRHGTLDAYRAAKLRIFAGQDAGDIAVLPAGFELARGVGGARRLRFAVAPGGEDADCLAREGRIWWREEPLMELEELRLRGAHNLENALAAALVCLERGIEPQAVRAGLSSFAGVPHRLEEVAERDGVLYVNDSKATNVASTLVALAAFADPGATCESARVHLILGGQGKGQDFTALRDPIAASCRAVYLIGEDAPLIARTLAGAGVPLSECGELADAVAAAGTAAAPGEIVLLSPACASFDQFADYEARGERFRELVLMRR